MYVWNLVEDCEVEWFSWFWLAWEDLAALRECDDPEDAFDLMEEIDFRLGNIT